MPTFRSDSSAYTTMSISLSNLARRAPYDTQDTTAYATVNWSVTLGSGTSLGASSNRTLYIYNDGGGLLGSAIIKNGISWDASQTYSGSFDIAFDAGTYDAFTWPLYIQTSNEGTQSCIWRNRTYCTDFYISWPEYWGYAGASSTLSFSLSIFETSVRLSWSGQYGGINNGITQFIYRYQTSDNNGSSWSSETSANTSATYVDTNTSSWPRGRLLRFRVTAVTEYGDNPTSGYSSNATKNRLPNIPGTPSTDKTVYVPGQTIVITFTPNIIPDPDSNLVGYELAMQDASGVWYNNGAIVGTKESTGEPYTINVDTMGWATGKRWKFFIRGYDSFGIRGNWSEASSLIAMGISMKILVSGSWRTVDEAKTLINGVWLPIVEAKVLKDGVWKTLN